MEIMTTKASDIRTGEVFEVPGFLGQYRMGERIHHEGTCGRYRVTVLPSGNPMNMVLADWLDVKVAR